MKVVQINAVYERGSTGTICKNISILLNSMSIENYVLYSNGNSYSENGIKYTYNFYIKIQALLSRILGNYGFNSKIATYKLIKNLKMINPNIIHIHNIHSHNLDLKVFFNYLSTCDSKIVWTFHDCWAFTGYCTYYDLYNCDKWRKNCSNCPQYRTYSWFYDKSKANYYKKKELFDNCRFEITTPSMWLKEQVLDSFLKDKNVTVINNAIDLEVFYPRKTSFKEQYGISEKRVLLGVAFDWGFRKGLDVFIELAKTLDSKYQIVLVGTNEGIDKDLPRNIISIHRTKSQQELAEIYSAADIFLNPTRDEVFGLVNIEALACGTPVIMFDSGGSPECIDETCGRVIEKNNIPEMISAIEELSNKKNILYESCIKRASNFDKNIIYPKYVELYYEVLK